MKAWERYITSVQDAVQLTYDTQENNIIAAANAFAGCTKEGGIIYVFGTGHSHMIADDVFMRAGMLANICAIVDPCVAAMNEITKTYLVEKIPGLGSIIVNYHRIKAPDVLVAVSNSGNNAVTIDVASACREKDVKVIAITGAGYSDQLRTLHPSGKKLKDCADIVLDNKSLFGDATVEYEGFDMKVGAMSTSTFCYLLCASLTQAVEILVEQGFHPDVYMSADKNGAAENNAMLVDKYFYRIRNL
ncbi:MAG: sugar isomerase domain-containing protein [Oscillospiraceae bacterium]|nr:sugar isomerase domain-containing protein [Oscillospiraceae bacterium]